MTEQKNIGAKIKKIRQAQKLSLQDLAERTMMTVSQIRKLEDKRIIPSLSPLIKIARALGVRLGTLLDDIEQQGPVVVRSGGRQEGVRFISNESEVREHLNFYSLAADKSGRAMEPFIVEIEPSRQSDYRLSSHEGEEFIYVLEGQVEINYGKELILLGKGDSVYLDSIVVHNVHAGNRQPARILAVFYTPYD